MSINQNEKWQDDQALERYEIISPLLDPYLDTPKRTMLRQQISQNTGISIRTLYRWEKAHSENGFTGLKPMDRDRKISSKLPSNFEDLVAEAIMLKREVPLRSIAQIIYILEAEGKAEPNVLKRSTLQRYLYEAGFGKKQMKKYSEAQYSSSKRFCMPHRMMLVQGDIKYGLTLPIGKNGKNVKTYLSCLIDDHSRLILSSQWYDNMEGKIVEDTVKKCILIYGKPDKFYFDNGKQYVTKELNQALSKLNIRILHHKPYSASSKGKVEKFNELVDSFLREVAIQKPKTLQEVNKWWQIWIDEYYHKKPHSGIAEYYTTQGWIVPEEGITPLQEWQRDSRRITHLDVNLIHEAFLHHETRRVDKAGCIKLQGQTYEVSTALIGSNVVVEYDPNTMDKVVISCDGIEDFEAQPVHIGEYCSKKPSIPYSMLSTTPETSRFLEAIAAKNGNSIAIQANAISFSNYRKDIHGGDNNHV